MKNLEITCSLLILLFFFGCSITSSVSSDYKKGVDFAKYQSFKIVKHPSDFPSGANPLHIPRITNAIRQEMTSIGYSLSTNPDLEVSWFVTLENKRYTNVYRDYYSRWYHPQHIEVYDYKEGTIVIDIFDSKTKMALWHGKTSRVIPEKVSNPEEEIRKVINSIFRQFAKDANLISEIAAK